MTAADDATLFAKLAAVTGQIRHIPKNGTNAHFGYKFATDADVSAALSKELSERNVQVFVSAGLPAVVDYTKDNGKKTRITDLLATVTFACGDTGATFAVTMPGTGEDATDKGTYKAITGAVKYALLKTFLVATGDDPEFEKQQAQEALAKVDAAFAAVAKPSPAPAPAVPAPPATQHAADTAAIQTAFDATITAAADEYTFQFGKHKGKSIGEVPADYLDWLLRQPAKEGFEQQHAEQHAMFRRELHRRGQVAS